MPGLSGSRNSIHSASASASPTSIRISITHPKFWRPWSLLKQRATTDVFTSTNSGGSGSGGGTGGWRQALPGTAAASLSTTSSPVIARRFDEPLEVNVVCGGGAQMSRVGQTITRSPSSTCSALRTATFTNLMAEYS